MKTVTRCPLPRIDKGDEALYVSYALNEIIAAGDYRLVRTVKRLAHLERLR